MKKYTSSIILVFVLTFALPTPSFAQGMMGNNMMGGFSNSSADWNEVVEHTAREEEQEGKEVWSTLQAKEVACANLNDEQYGVLGEYFMGQMSGESHASMNAMMIQAHGENRDEQNLV